MMEITITLKMEETHQRAILNSSINRVLLQQLILSTIRGL